MLRDATDCRVDRFGENPLLTPDSDDRIGTNINGPSVIRVPDWFDGQLGQYYMYFAHHSGEYIRLAYAEDLTGPWTVYAPGTLHLDETQFDGHIASPDVHVDHDEERIRMYFHGGGSHGPYEHGSGEFAQVTDVATSANGIDFDIRARTLGVAYFRVWDHDGAYYAVGNDGHLYHGTDPLAPFERKQELFPRNRHFALRFTGEDRVQVFLTRRGDRPERVMVATMDLSPPIEEWRADPHPPETVLWPAREYEGGALPPRTSKNGGVNERVRALRDPAIFEEDGRTYLFYAVAGESGIAGAEIR
jgi:hypothetical protein